MAACYIRVRLAQLIEQSAYTVQQPRGWQFAYQPGLSAFQLQAPSYVSYRRSKIRHSEDRDSISVVSRYANKKYRCINLSVLHVFASDRKNTTLVS